MAVAVERAELVDGLPGEGEALSGPGRNVMEVLHQLMLGNPWRPPGQAFSP